MWVRHARLACRAWLEVVEALSQVESWKPSVLAVLMLLEVVGWWRDVQQQIELEAAIEEVVVGL